MPVHKWNPGPPQIVTVLVQHHCDRSIYGRGFRVQGLGFWVWGLGWRVLPGPINPEEALENRVAQKGKSHRALAKHVGPRRCNDTTQQADLNSAFGFRAIGSRRRVEF